MSNDNFQTLTSHPIPGETIARICALAEKLQAGNERIPELIVASNRVADASALLRTETMALRQALNDFRRDFIAELKDAIKDHYDQLSKLYEGLID